MDVVGELWLVADRLVLRQNETLGEAATLSKLSFPKSPTVLVDGVDPFADPNAAVGLTCPLCPTETGWVGAPSRQQLTEALSSGM